MIVSTSPPDLLDIRPSPNNGTHGSLNHLLKRPVYLPVHPAQLSHDIPCESSGTDPGDDLQCTCSSLNRTVVCASSVTELMGLYEHLNSMTEGIEVSVNYWMDCNEVLYKHSKSNKCKLKIVICPICFFYG